MIKRDFDFIVAGMGLIVLAIFLAIIALLIKITSKGPVFFRQERVGLNGKIFRIHKFRTMVVDAESIGPKITIGADSRITKFGRILRKTKLDELPQLIDVLLGNMSLVGPRPEVPEYVAIYPAVAREQVFSVRPGITDWASIQMIDENQLLAASANPKEAYIKEVMPQKLAIALKYVATQSFTQDLKIIWMTLLRLVKR